MVKNEFRDLAYWWKLIDKAYKAKGLPAGLKIVHDNNSASYFHNGRWHHLIKDGKAA